jgi:hypothetical protein
MAEKTLEITFKISERYSLTAICNSNQYDICIKSNETVIKFDEFIFNQLVSVKDIIDRNISTEYETHLGRRIYVKLSPGMNQVRICEYFFDMEIGCARPKSDGIILNITEWGQLQNIFKKVYLCFPNLAAIEDCYFTHNNQMAMFTCIQCTPFFDDEQSFMYK